MRNALLPAALLLAAVGLTAQSYKPVASRAESKVDLSNKGELIISNTTFEVTSSSLPGRPPADRLLIRKTVNSQKYVDDKGTDSKVTVDAWVLGVDPKSKPLWSVSATGVDARVVDFALLSVSRGTEDTDWWSLYRLGDGVHLFDTDVPLLTFSLGREIQELRYVGVQTPGDDIKDARLKDPHVIGVITVASNEKVLGEALITCDDVQRARQLRSFADETRTLRLLESPRVIELKYEENYPSQPKPVVIRIPVLPKAVDLAHIQAPAGLRVTPWKR